MKILVLTSLFPPHVFGGAEIAAYNMVKLLVSRGHDVHVATMFEQDAEAAWGTLTPEGYRLYRLKTPRTHTLHTRHNGVSKIKKLIWHLQDYFDPRNSSPIIELLKTVQPDHIDIHNITGFGFNALSALNKSKATVAYVLHDVGLACFHASLFKNGKNCTRQCVGCIGTSFLRQNNLKKIKRLAFISPTRSNIDNITQYASFIKNKPSLVLHNVANDIPALPERTANRKTRLVYVGRLDPVKGIDFLLDVLGSLAEKYDFHIDILGRGPLEESLTQKYAGFAWLTFRGFVSPADVARALSEADLYCMPSIWAETYGMATAQSLLLGTPVIGSNIGGTPELVRDGVTGIIAEADDKVSWTKAFITIFENPALLETWRANTRQFSHEFDKNRIGEQYEGFVKGL